MKKPLLLLLFIIGALTLYAQSDCNEKFSSADVLRWKSQLKFIPKYLKNEEMESIIKRLSDKAYNQWHKDIRVSCGDADERQYNVDKMKKIWGDSVSAYNLTFYYSAYYVFYQLEKSALN